MSAGSGESQSLAAADRRRACNCQRRLVLDGYRLRCRVGAAVGSCSGYAVGATGCNVGNRVCVRACCSCCGASVAPGVAAVSARRCEVKPAAAADRRRAGDCQRRLVLNRNPYRITIAPTATAVCLVPYVFAVICGVNESTGCK